MSEDLISTYPEIVYEFNTPRDFLGTDTSLGEIRDNEEPMLHASGYTPVSDAILFLLLLVFVYTLFLNKKRIYKKFTFSKKV